MPGPGPAPNCPGRWRGVVSLGYGPDGRRVRRKVSGKTRAVVQDRLKALHSDLDSGVKASPNYTSAAPRRTGSLGAWRAGRRRR